MHTFFTHWVGYRLFPHHIKTLIPLDLFQIFEHLSCVMSNHFVTLACLDESQKPTSCVMLNHFVTLKCLDESQKPTPIHVSYHKEFCYILWEIPYLGRLILMLLQPADFTETEAFVSLMNAPTAMLPCFFSNGWKSVGTSFDHIPSYLWDHTPWLLTCVMIISPSFGELLIIPKPSAKVFHPSPFLPQGTQSPPSVD